MSSQLFTTTEVAARTHVAEGTVRGWIKTGRLQALRLGKRRLRVSENALEAFIATVYEEAGNEEPLTCD